MIARAFAAAYPDGTVGLVLLEASSEPEITFTIGSMPERGTTAPCIRPRTSGSISRGVRELEDAQPLGAMPLIVATPGSSKTGGSRPFPI
jgi:hypothetical protein